MKPAKKLLLRFIPVIMALFMVIWSLPSAFAMIGSAISQQSAVPAFSKNAVIGNEISFQDSDFVTALDKKSDLEGIVITALPDAQAGVLKLGKRTLLTGEAVAVESISSLKFLPATDDVLETTFNYLPVFKSGASVESITVGIHMLSGENKAPVAENIELTTYKNIAATGVFKATDPDGDKLSFRVVDKPARGEIEIATNGDGEFKYTPFKNKTGKDTFSYSAVDAVGNVSQPATITVTIDKPSTKLTYADMDGNGAHYAAIRLAEQGILTGEKLGSQYFFNPDQTVSRGEFVAMAVTALDSGEIPPVSRTGFADDDETPSWVKPFASTALKAGIINGVSMADGRKALRSDHILTRGEAAVIINNALRITDAGTESAFSDEAAIPVWAYQAAINVDATGIMPAYSDGTMRLMDPVSRAQAAELLCSALDAKKQAEKKTGLLNWLW